MTENQPIPLIGLVVTDKFSGEILVLHRTDHMQWQLPGGRIEERDAKVPGVPPAVAAAMRHASEELRIEVHDEEKFRLLGKAAFSQWGKDYECQYFEVHTSIDLADRNDVLTYDAMETHNLFKLNTVREPHYSANVVNFAGMLASGEILLTL